MLLDNLGIQQSLEFLIYATIIMLIIVSVFLVKLLVDLSSLIKSLQNILSIVKHDLGPTIKEFKRALININSIASTTDNQFKDINKVISSAISAFSGSGQNLSSKAKLVFSSLRKGLSAGTKVFFEEKKTK